MSKEQVICEPHKTFPCRVCGTKHFDGCECGFCRPLEAMTNKPASETPLTDSECIRKTIQDMNTRYEIEFVYASFARHLERELTQSQSELAKVKAYARHESSCQMFEFLYNGNPRECTCGLEEILK